MEHWPGKLNNDDTVSPFNGVSVDSRVQRAIVCVVIIMTVCRRPTDNPSVDCRPCHVLLERHERCPNKQTNKQRREFWKGILERDSGRGFSKGILEGFEHQKRPNLHTFFGLGSDIMYSSPIFLSSVHETFGNNKHSICPTLFTSAFIVSFIWILHP